MVAWFNKKKAKAMAKIEKRLKAESQARAKAEERLKAEIETRASAERKVKAEAEKMLLTQYRRYSLLAERVEAQAKEEIVAAKAEAKEAVEKVRSYKAALTQAEEKLAKAKEQVKAEAIARAKAEQSAKAEKEARERVEARAKEAIAEAEAEAEEKIRSYAVALAQAEEKLTKANEKSKAEALARAEAEEKLKAKSEKRQRVEAQAKEAIAAAKAEEEAEEKVRSYAVALTQAEEKSAEAKEKSKTEAKLAEAIDTFKRILRHIFHPGAIKGKFVLISALVILSTIAFAVIVLKDPPAAESSNATTQEEIPVPITLIGSDPDGEQLTYNVVTGKFHGSLSGPAPSMTYTSALNYNGPDNSIFRVNDGNGVPALDTQSSTITVNPAPPKRAKLSVLDSYDQLSLCSLLTVLDGYNQKNKKALSADGETNIVQYSDDERWETSFGSYTSYDFSDASIPVDVAITAVIVCVEHFEEEQFAQGKLEWAVGTGWPTKPVVWAAINAPVHEGQSHEAIDLWDVTSIVDTREKIDSLQLQVKNNNITNRKTLIDYTYVIVEWD